MILPRFGEKLVLANMIDRAQLDAALSHQAETGQHLGEALLELGYISEENLLKYLAKEFQTRFVSTKKLSRISLPADLLSMVPQKVAEQHAIFPVILDRASSVLGVVTCEPQNQTFIDELKGVTGLENIQVFVALKEAIWACIKKHYKGERQAFAAIDRDNKQEMDQVVDLYADNFLNETIRRNQESKASEKSDSGAFSNPDSLQSFSDDWTQKIEEVSGKSLELNQEFIQALQIMVALVEKQNAQRKDHSTNVVLWCEALCEALNLSRRERNHCLIAGYLHDLGKQQNLHLTLPDIADDSELRKQAERYHLTPVQLFESVDLPVQVNHMLRHLYESFDGRGLPSQLVGSEIPLGSRILALVDAYEDLIHNPDNFVGQILSSADALQELERLAGRFFDPDLVRMLEKVVSISAASQMPNTLKPDSGDSSHIPKRPSLDDDTDLEVTQRDDAGMARESWARQAGTGSGSLPKPPTGSMAGMIRTASRTISGTLEGKTALTLIKTLAGKRRTGMLSLRLQDKRGAVYFERGHIVQAVFGAAQAEEAFLELVNLRDCLFVFDPAQNAPAKEIKTSTARLIQFANQTE